MIVAAAAASRAKILRPADLGQRAVLIEQILQRHRIGDLAASQQLADRREDAAMHSIAEMLRLKKLAKLAR